MTKVDKKLASMKLNPQDNWKIEDLYALAKRYDIHFRQPGTSHVTFIAPNGIALTVPARRPIKPIYIKRFVELIEALKEEPKYD